MREYLHILFLCLLVLSCGFLVYFPLTNTDIWWHLASAREMLKTSSFLIKDPFTYTESIQPWINIHWLFQIIVYKIFSLGGGWAVIGFKIITYSLSTVIIYLALNRNRTVFPSLFIFPYLIFSARYLVLARPIVFTLLCIACSIYCFERYIEHKKIIWLILLFPIQIFWCNVQGLFILGIVIAAVYAAGMMLHKTPGKTAGLPAAVLVLLPAALYGICILNPNTWKVLAYPFKLFFRISPEYRNLFSANVSENAPLLLLWQNGDRQLVFAVLFTAICGLALFLIRRNSADYSHIILFTAFFILAVMAKRNILLFFFIAAPIMCRYLSEWMNKYKWNRPVSLSALILILSYTGLSHGNVIKKYPEGSPFSPFRYPANAVEYMREYPVEGNIFNSIRYGGFLDWTIFPHKKTFIDGRLIIRTPEFFANYLSILDNPQRFAILSETENITHVLIPIAIFKRYLPLAKWLYDSPDWGLVYSDGASAIFIQKTIPGHKFLEFSNEESVETVKQIIYSRWNSDSAIRCESLRYFCNFLHYTGEKAWAGGICNSCNQ